jgi:hypothetical protein
MTLTVSNIDDVVNILNSNEVMVLKFDNKNSKYDEYFNSLEFKTVNITDEEIIEFYEVDVLPTLLVYKNKNLIDSVQGYFTKSILLKKIQSILN